MPVVNVLISVPMHQHLLKLAAAAGEGASTGDVVRALIQIDMDGKLIVGANPKVLKLVQQLYDELVGKKDLRRGPTATTTPETDAECLRLSQQGFSRREIANELGLTSGTVCRALQRATRS